MGYAVCLFSLTGKMYSMLFCTKTVLRVKLTYGFSKYKKDLRPHVAGEEKSKKFISQNECHNELRTDPRPHIKPELK